MITEKGTVKTAAEINAEVQKEMNKTNFILSIVYTVCGAVLFIIGLVFIVMDIITDVEREDMAEGYLFFVLGLILFVCGIIVIVARSKAIKNADKHKTVEENEFFRDHFISRQYVDGEHLVTAKVYYDRLATFRETKNYIFLYNTRVTATAVDKRKLTPEELAAVKDLVARGMANARTGAQPAQPAAQPAQPTQPAQPAPTAPRPQAPNPNPAVNPNQPQYPAGNPNGNNGNAGQGY